MLIYSLGNCLRNRKCPRGLRSDNCISRLYMQAWWRRWWLRYRMACGGIGGAINLASQAFPGCHRLFYIHSRPIIITLCLITIRVASHLVALILSVSSENPIALPSLPLYGQSWSRLQCVLPGRCYRRDNWPDRPVVVDASKPLQLMD